MKLGRFIGAPRPDREVVFTKNATEAINLVAYAWGRAQPAARRRRRADRDGAPRQPRAVADAGRDELGIELRYIPLDDDFRLDLDRPRAARRRGQARRRHRACPTCSARSTPAPIVAAAPTRPGPWCWSTARSSAPHRPVDVAALGIDFLAFTGHKMLGPTGIGVLWARAELLEAMPPFLGGGEMILDVRARRLPAERAPLAVRGRHAADRRGDRARCRRRLPRGRRAWTRIRRPRDRARPPTRSTPRRDASATIRDLRPPAGPDDRGGVISFAFGGVHPHDVAQVLDQYGVCVRAGHHCAKPLMRRSGRRTPPPGPRSSLYNDEHDIDALVEGLATVPEDCLPMSPAADARRDEVGRPADDRPRRPLPRDHPRPLPLPA